MKILIINAGSSTVKFQIFEGDEFKLQTICKGTFSRIGELNSFYNFFYQNNETKIIYNIDTHKTAVDLLIKTLKEKNIITTINDLDIIGYRVVHGMNYREIQNVQLTYKKVFEIAKKLTKVHAHGLINTVNYLMEIAKDVPQYFDFDTLFHVKDLLKTNYLYAIPYKFYENDGIRKYGEHGLSHKYIANHVNELFKKNKIIISCHLGSGSSISCMSNGKCIDNSMGLTPLAGVVMGTRCGNIDPSVVTYIMNEYNYSPEKMDNIMNLESGMKGICGLSDMRDIENACAKGDDRAKLAFDVTINSYVKSIGARILQVGELIENDLSNLIIVFTAGIGENSSLVRRKVIEKFKFLGIELDEKLNNKPPKGDCKISKLNSKAEVWIMPTNEELTIAQDICEYLCTKKY